MAKKPKLGSKVTPIEPSDQPDSAVSDSPAPKKSAKAVRSKLPAKPDGKPVRRPAARHSQSHSSVNQADGHQEVISLGCPIVGIGASAGGLDAYKKFFSKMPPDGGVAFILVPHLDPTRESLMVELLARQTKMPVHEATDGLSIEPNCVYIIPPNQYLSVADRKLKLTKPTERHGSPTAIDFFFRSLANELQERSIGIILSGTSSHGTTGLKEIKLAGGMVMVQSPETAEHDQMPRSAIATGMVDFILPPEQMPEALLKYVQHPYVHGSSVSPTEESSRDLLNRILAVLKTRTKYDFRNYRKNMLMRRVLRRMGLRHFEQMADYLEYLRNNPEEVNLLYNDLLIGVTDFFRDPEAFQVLQQRVIPELVGTDSTSTIDAGIDSSRSAVRSSIRVWIPACASGEEAYSVAMLFFEQYSAVNKRPELQIFATDIDERSLDVARQGIYSESSIAELSPERLRRFFTKIDPHHWQVSKPLRESITFAPQNLISDAPFSKLDLISCRNLLIYLEPDIQAKVIRLFHFALVEGGYLLLGPSESIGREVDLFEPISKKWRVFRRLGLTRRAPVDIPIIATEERRRLRVPALDLTPPPAVGFKDLMQQLILEEFAPAAALINHNHEIITVLGPLVNYLEFPPGEMTRDLLALARPGLRTKIRAAVIKAMHTGEVATDTEARVKRGGVYAACSITVKPVVEPRDAAHLLLVTFQDREPVSGGVATDEREARTADETESRLIQHLEHELKATREDLQSTVEEYESSNEELKASNEEVMSMNEELQSANEELETSKEELQSLNEELSTVNNQLQDKLEELDRSNSDLANLMASSEVATVFLDTQLRVKRFTPPVAKLLNLRSTDVDRPITDFAPKFSDTDLLDDCHAVLDKLMPIEKEVWADTPVSRSSSRKSNAKGNRDDSALREGGSRHPIPDHSRSRCYLRRILPYRTADNRIEGVVITFLDITQRMAAETQSRRLASVLWDSRDAITLHDFDGDILAWNRGAEKMYGFTEAEALQMNIREIVPEHRSEEALAYVQALQRNEPVTAFETQRKTKSGQVLEVELTITAYRDEHGQPIGVATTERDISERKRDSLSLRQLNETLEQRVADQTQEVKLLAEALSHLGEGVMITADHLDWPGPTILYVNEALCQISGYSAQELIGKTPRILQGGGTTRSSIDRIKADLSAGRSCTVELVNYRKDGTPYDAELFITALFDADGKRTNFVGINRDITHRKHFEQALRESEERFRIIIEGVQDYAILMLDPDGNVVSWNAGAERIKGYRAAEIMGRHFSIFYPPEAVASGKPQSELAVAEREGRSEDEGWRERKDGTRFWANVVITALRDESGRLKGYSKITRDITEQHQAKELLRKSEERIRAILKTATDAIITIDQQGTITAVNPATTHLFGYAEEELIGQNINTIMPQPYRDEHDGYIARYLKTGEPRIIGIGREVVGLRKNGTTFPVDLAVSQVDHMGLFTGIIRDISFRKDLQKQVLEVATEEQRRIGQELHDGTGQELTGLTLFGGTLLDLLNSAPHRAAGQQKGWIIEDAELLRLRQTANRLTQGLVEANRHVQQLSHGIMPVQIDAEGLSSALEELATSINAQQDIVCRFNCPVQVVVTDTSTASHLYRIAQEAVNNALRHGQASQIGISLSLVNDEIVLEVIDNGVGFEPGSLDRSAGAGTNRGFGLEIMNYRAGMIGGTLRVTRRDAGGMMVRCVVRPRRKEE